ncbi:MAG: glycosyltransferase [Thermoplasmata archaeon]|nr:glycosyltransferase [Thermoplasmata archaeon]
MATSTSWVSGGIPAYNTGPRLRESVRSLLDQTLPDGFQWSKVLVVVSGCTDDTPQVAEALAREDPRVTVVRQESREGKASALRAIFERAEGDCLVLLNGDATAEPGSVAKLLEVGEGTPRPYAIMGRPCLPSGGSRGLRRGIEVLWDLHHRVHQATLSREEGNHLSDELWLLPLPVAAPLPVGVVNDGAYIGAWLRENGGQLRYASEACVTIEIPRTPAEHLRQRRRISWGNRQVRELLGVTPVSWIEFTKSDPAGAVRVLAATLRDHPAGIPWTLLLIAMEAQAMILAAWDRYVLRRNHVLWEIVSPARGHPSPGSSGTGTRRGEPELGVPRAMA